MESWPLDHLAQSGRRCPLHLVSGQDLAGASGYPFFFFFLIFKSFIELYQKYRGFFFFLFVCNFMVNMEVSEKWTLWCLDQRPDFVKWITNMQFSFYWLTLANKCKTHHSFRCLLWDVCSVCQVIKTISDYRVTERFIAEALITRMDVSNGRRSILPGDAEGWALHEDSPLEGCLPHIPNPMAWVWDLSAPDFLQPVCRGTQRGQVLILLIALWLFSERMDACPFLKKKKKKKKACNPHLVLWSLFFFCEEVET